MSDSLRLRADQIEWRQVEDEVVVLDLRDATYFAVNKTGAALWPSLVEGATREQLLACLTDRFAVEEPAASRDVDAFLKDVGERGLLAG
jgi:hypothetical protein